MALTPKKQRIFSFVAIVGGVATALVALAGYKFLVGTFNGEQPIKKKAKTAGNTNLEELLEKDEGAFYELNSALGSNRAIRDGYSACLEELNQRRNGEEAPNKGQEHKWNLIFTVVSQGGTGSVTNIKLPEGSSWPPHFDEDTKNCYTELILSQEFATSRDFIYELEWEYCVTPNATPDTP